MSNPDKLSPSPLVKARSYVVKDAPVGTLVSNRTDFYHKAQDTRLKNRKIDDIDFNNIQFSLLNQDQLDAAVATTVILAHHSIDESRELSYYRPDHELTTTGVDAGYYRFRQYGILRAYLEISRRINRDKFALQLKEIRKEREDEQPIQVPLVQHLTEAAMQSIDSMFFYIYFAADVKETELKKLLKGFAVDQHHLTAFLLSRVQTELTEDPQSLEQVDAVLLDFEPYGQAFDPDFEAHRAAMLKVSPLGLVRADFIRKTVKKLAGEEHLPYLEKQRPFREKLLAA